MIRYDKKNFYLSDFTITQYVKRKERYFQIVGLDKFLAPEMFTEDGYGY